MNQAKFEGAALEANLSRAIGRQTDGSFRGGLVDVVEGLPGQKIVDATLGVTLDDAGNDVGQIGLRVYAVGGTSRFVTRTALSRTDHEQTEFGFSGGLLATRIEHPGLSERLLSNG